MNPDDPTVNGPSQPGATQPGATQPGPVAGPPLGPFQSSTNPPLGGFGGSGGSFPSAWGPAPGDTGPYGSGPFQPRPTETQAPTGPPPPPFQQSPFQQSPYQQSPYQQNPYQQSPYQQSPFQPTGVAPVATATRKRPPNWFIVSLVVAVILSAVGTLAVVNLAGGSFGTGSNNAASGSLLTPRPGVLPSGGGNGSGNGSGDGADGSGSSGNGSQGSANPPTNGSGATIDAAAVSAKVSPGIVNINTRLDYQQAAAAGTGMVLTSDGEILTNNHVIDGATEIVVTSVESGKQYEATVVGTDPTDDVAVLQLKDASGLSTITVGDSDKVAVGDPIVALGNAGGKGGDPTVVTGTVSDTDQAITASDQNGANAERLTGLIQVAAAIEAGDSGGPLANAAGEVIGMNTAASGGTRFESKVSVGFAIPIAHAIAIAKEIESGNETDTIHIGLPAFLGVEVVPASAANGSSTRSGALVAGVASGSPAEKAGLGSGDTITSVDKQSITTAESLTAQMHKLNPGDKATIGWTDDSGAKHTATVTLGTGPAD